MALMARNAWFTLPQATIADFLEHAGHPDRAGSTLFEAVFGGSKSVLGLPETDIMQRFAKLPIHTEYLGDLLEVDEAQSCLDEQDRQELTKVKASHAEHLVERGDFVRAFQRQREALLGGSKRSQQTKACRRSRVQGPH